MEPARITGSISKATLDDLTTSGIPDANRFEVNGYGFVGGKEAFLRVWSDDRGTSYIEVFPDTSNDWSEHIPTLARVLAQGIGAVVEETRYESKIPLDGKPAQSQVAEWMRAWTPYFDDARLHCVGLRYYDLSAAEIEASHLRDRFRKNVL